MQILGGGGLSNFTLETCEFDTFDQSDENTWADQNSQVGEDFEMPPPGMFRLHLAAEIVKAAGFEWDDDFDDDEDDDDDYHYHHHDTGCFFSLGLPQKYLSTGKLI